MQKNFVAKFHISVKDYNIIAFAFLLSTVWYYWQCLVIVLNAISGLLVENHLILLNDFLCPACNVTCALGVPALQNFRDFFDVETRLLVQKNFYFRQ